jgi:hypothetical protein
MKRQTIHRGLVLLAVFGVVLGLVGCAGWWHSESNQIRRAVLDHEMERSGSQVDDVIVRLSPGEFRDDLGHGSRMVWLVSNALERPYREGEYFRLRDPGRSYIFLRDVRIEESRDRAKVTLALYAPATGSVTKEVSVSRTATGWRVTSERPAAGTDPVRGATRRILASVG